MIENPKFVYLLGSDDFNFKNISKDSFVVYQGHHGDAGVYHADVILPGAAYTEKSATYINTEGRAQVTRAAVAPPTEAREDWKIIRALSEVMGNPLQYDDVETLRGRMQRLSPTLTCYDSVESSSHDIMELGLKQFTKSKDSANIEPFKVSIKDFYLTNSIARASPTMAKCSQVKIN